MDRSHSTHRTAHASSRTRSTRPSSHNNRRSAYSSHPSSSRVPPTTTASSSTRPRGYPKPLGRGRGFPVLGRGRFLHERPASFVLVPGRAKRGKRVYDVRSRRGERLFQVLPKRFCLHDTRTLVDVGSGVPLLRMKGFLVSARSTMTISSPDGGALLVLQKTSVISLKRRTVYGYIKGRVKSRPDLVVTADAKGRTFTFTDRRSMEIASVRRYRAKRRDAANKYEYRMYVSPGYDTALFLMCMICLHEIWNE